MEEITVSSFRASLRKGKAVPGKPALVIGKQIGTSLYTWNRIHECLERATTDTGHQQQDSNLVIKASQCGIQRAPHPRVPVAASPPAK